MCGIAVAAFGPRSSRQSEQVVAAMVDAMGHRGPDGRGSQLCAAGEDSARVVMGHARLSIIDLSDDAAQPMTTADGTATITFNGEIYNFRALRQELEANGHRFRSHSDTEVILEGYRAWGEDVVTRLHGMFGLAIWDATRRRLVIARDRFGIKPLYLSQTPDRLLVASELRAILTSGLVPRRLDTIALDHFLAYQSVPPPRTLVAGIAMFPPAHVGVWDSASRRLTTRNYWDPLGNRSAEAAGASNRDARAITGTRLVESVERHLVSDVPVATFLSGGLDSTAIAMLQRHLGTRPRTFAITLPGSSGDEAVFAREAARACDADHTEISIGDREAVAALPEALGRVDHPSGDGMNAYLVSHAVRQAGFKVALSGVGGDELFGGYPSFRRMGRLASYQAAWQRSPRALRAAAATAVRAAGRSVSAAKAAAVLETDGSLPEAFPLLRQMFSTASRRALLGDAAVDRAAAHGDPYVELLRAARERHPAADTMSMVSYAELRTYMHDVLLRDADQMSMAHGLEVRVPFVDHALVEWVMGLPESHKTSADTPKQWLVDSLPIQLPEACVRRPKRGFTLPFAEWMRGSLREFCESHLGPSGLAGRGVVDPDAVSSLWTGFIAGDRRTTWSRVWTLVALDAWLEHTKVTA